MLTDMAIRRSNLRWMIFGLAIFVVCGGLAFRLLLTAADGAPVELASLRGKVVLLELWSAT